MRKWLMRNEAAIRFVTAVLQLAAAVLQVIVRYR